jgi:hypothetical protein
MRTCLPFLIEAQGAWHKAQGLFGVTFSKWSPYAVRLPIAEFSFNKRIVL